MNILQSGTSSPTRKNSSSIKNFLKKRFNERPDVIQVIIGQLHKILGMTWSKSKQRDVVISIEWHREIDCHNWTVRKVSRWVLLQLIQSNTKFYVYVLIKGFYEESIDFVFGWAWDWLFRFGWNLISSSLKYLCQFDHCFKTAISNKEALKGWKIP